jgi:26 proteasome complex subunit DSS1
MHPFPSFAFVDGVAPPTSTHQLLPVVHRPHIPSFPAVFRSKASLSIIMSSDKKEETKKEEKEGKDVASSLIEAIEEDDDFEEFNPAKWGSEDEDAEDAQQWKDNWDDDDIDDDFTNHLRAELARGSSEK